MLQLRRALCLLCCIGVLSLASFADARTYYISPTGSDRSTGATRSTSWKTFAVALKRLVPGDTLILLDGTYQKSTTGLPYINCDAKGNAAMGTAKKPITIRADNERKAFLKGDGLQDTLYMINCSHWKIIGLRGESADNSKQNARGSVFTVHKSSFITLRRNLGANNNRYTNSHIFAVIYDCHDVLLEENEAYSFHRHGYSVFRSKRVVLRRNYGNSRNRADIPNGFVSHSGFRDRGDDGISIYYSTDSLIENNIDEGNESIYFFGSRNRAFGNITINDGYGFGVAHHCCGNIETDGNLLVNNVSIGAKSIGLLVQSASKTRVRHHTALDSRGKFAAFTANNRISKQNNPNLAWTIIPSFVVEHSLFANNAGYGTRIYHAKDFSSISFVYVNAFGNVLGNFGPGTSNLQHATQIDPKLGMCKVYIPASSPLKGAGRNGADIGANVLYRYQDGLLTTRPLWHATTGGFPCGAIVKGVNDVAGVSCFDVHKRLNIGAAFGCPLPKNYGRPPVPEPVVEPIPERKETKPDELVSFEGSIPEPADGGAALESSPEPIDLYETIVDEPTIGVERIEPPKERSELTSDSGAPGPVNEDAKADGVPERRELDALQGGDTSQGDAIVPQPGCRCAPGGMPDSGQLSLLFMALLLCLRRPKHNALS